MAEGLCVRAEVRAACDLAVDVIVTLPESEWAGWVLYVLEQLDGVSRLELVIPNAAAGIITRLNEGSW